MKKFILTIFLISPFMIGCRTINKLFTAQEYPPEVVNLPDSYTIEGVTSSEFQVIKPVRCVDSLVRVWVKKEGALDFRELNKYEFKAETIGNTGQVMLKRECVPTYDETGRLIKLVITAPQCAPPGTSYRIESTLIKNSAASRLY